MTTTDEYGEPLVCLDGGEEMLGCMGPVELRYPMSPTGRWFPRCEQHYDQRLAKQDEINERYPDNPPPDWSPLDAGEHWSDDY